MECCKNFTYPQWKKIVPQDDLPYKVTADIDRLRWRCKIAQAAEKIDQSLNSYFVTLEDTDNPLFFKASNFSNLLEYLAINSTAISAVFQYTDSTHAVCCKRADGTIAIIMPGYNVAYGVFDNVLLLNNSCLAGRYTFTELFALAMAMVRNFELADAFLRSIENDYAQSPQSPRVYKDMLAKRKLWEDLTKLYKPKWAGNITPEHIEQERQRYLELTTYDKTMLLKNAVSDFCQNPSYDNCAILADILMRNHITPTIPNYSALNPHFDLKLFVPFVSEIFPQVYFAPNYHVNATNNHIYIDLAFSEKQFNDMLNSIPEKELYVNPTTGVIDKNYGYKVPKFPFSDLSEYTVDFAYLCSIVHKKAKDKDALLHFNSIDLYVSTKELSDVIKFVDYLFKSVPKFFMDKKTLYLSDGVNKIAICGRENRNVNNISELYVEKTGKRLSDAFDGDENNNKDNRLRLIKIQAAAKLKLQQQRMRTRGVNGVEDIEKYISFIKKSLNSHSHSTIECTELISAHNRNKVNRLLNKKIEHYFFNSDDVRHIWNNHGIGNETDPKQIPLCKDDFCRLPEILATPTTITYSGTNCKNGQSVTFSKVYNDDRQFCVLVDVFSESLNVKTGYKKPLNGMFSGSTLYAIDDVETSPNLTPEADKTPWRFDAKIINFFIK